VTVDVDQFEQFAKAYGDPTSPTYNNAKATYKYLNPDVTDDSAKKAGSRMLKDERVRKHLVDFRRKAGALAAKTHEDYLLYGWQMMEEMRSLMVADAKYAGALAKLFETVGKGHGYLVTKSEDLTPLERKAPISPAEAQTLLETRLARFKKLNQPNPLPAVAAVAVATVPADDVEPEHTILPRDDEPHEAPNDALHEG
jgi:hypothetical protein